MKKLFVAMVFALAVTPAAAIDAGKAFDDPELQARYEKIIDERTTIIVPADSNLLDLLIAEDP